MPTEYGELVAALKLTSIPFMEYGWNTRPEGTYGVVSLDFEGDSLDADNLKADRSWEGSVDVFYRLIAERDDVIATVEEILTEVLGNSWTMNSVQHEQGTGLFHIEWTFEVMNTPEEDDQDGV